MWSYRKCSNCMRLPSEAACGLSLRCHYLQWSHNKRLFLTEKRVGSHCVDYIEYQANCGLIRGTGGKNKEGRPQFFPLFRRADERVINIENPGRFAVLSPEKMKGSEEGVQ